MHVTSNLLKAKVLVVPVFRLTEVNPKKPGIVTLVILIHLKFFIKELLKTVDLRYFSIKHAY